MKKLKHLMPLKHKKFLFAVALLLVIVVAVVILTQPKEDTSEDILWREYKVSYGDITASLDGGGTLEATGVHHSFDVDLKVEQLLVEVGQEVKTGDVLVKYSVDALKEKITELNDSLQKAQRTLEDAQNNKRKAQLENELASNGTQQDTQSAYESGKRELENAIRTAAQKIKQLEEKIEKLKQDLKNAKASSDGSTDSDELKRMKEELEKLQAELAKLKANSSANGNDGQIASLEQQRSSLNTQLKEINAKINAIQNNVNSLNSLKQQLSDVQAELASVRDQIAALPEGDEGLAALQTQEGELVIRETELQNTINDFQDESGTLAELKKQKTDLENQISSINVQISSLEDAVYDAAAIQKKQTQIDEVQKKINALSSKEEKIATLTEQIQQAQTDLEAARFDLETQQIALKTLNDNHNSQTEQDRENQTTQGQINALANAALDNAIKNAQAEVEKLRSKIAEANEIQNTPELTAKADGVVTELKYTEGDDVPGGKSIVTIGDSGEKLVVIQIAQEDIGTVEVGQVVEMQFLSNPDETLTGKVSSKSLVSSEGGDGVNYKVTILFDEEQPELLQGMTCSVKFILKRVEDVLTLSNKAITLRDGKQFVTVLMPDGSHEEREIQTGFSDGRISEIASGLADGDTVLVAG